MADAVLDDEKCLLPTCNRSGPLNTFKVQAVIECATEQHDDETGNKMQACLDSQGEQASVKLHKNCYCSFISKEHIKRLLARKRKAGSMDLEEAPIPRVRSQVKEFDFKNNVWFVL